MTREGVTRWRRGSEALGALLAVPLLAVGLGGVAEAGRYADRLLSVTEIARDAAREGAVRPLDWNPGPTGTALGFAREEFARAGLDGDASARLVGDAPEQRLEVTIEAPFAPLTGWFPIPTTVRSTASYRLNDQ